MGEGDSKSEVSDLVTNGTKSPEKEAVKVVDKKENGLKEMKEDKKEDNGGNFKDKIVAEGEGEEKEDEVKELKEDKEDKGEVKEDKEEKEEPKVKAMEVENEKDVEMAEKTEGSEEKKEGEKENGCDQMNDKEEAKEQEGGDEKEGEEDRKDEVKESEKEKEEEKVEAKEDAMKSKEDKSSKKRSRGKSAEDKEVDMKKKVVQKELEPRTPTSDRPVRERKSVERLVAIFEKDNSREFHIEKGQGTPLKDIPNVAYKLSRKKSDDTFKLLHMILYGRRGKANQIKHNISRFSGFIWHDNEEKQRLKIKEKLDKCVKEKLLEFCDVLDIPITKTTSRKEDVVVKLLDFLVAPHATTTELLAEKDQGKKRKRSATKGASASRKGSSKSRKKTGDASTKEGKKATSESDDESQDDKDDEDEEKEKENGVAESSEDEKSEQSDSEEKKDVSENESEEDAPQEKVSARKAKIKTKKNSLAVESSGKAASRTVVTPRKARSVTKGTPKKSSANSFKVVESADKTPKVFSRKKKEEEPKKEISASKKSVTKEKSATKEKPATKEKSASKDKSGKKAVKGKEKTKEGKLKPSDDELRNAICDILKEVDFNTATFTDILKQLAKQFKSDLAPRKSSIKLMIQDELTKLADEADDEDEDDEGDAEKNDPKLSSKEVEV